jgi:hypothetical protein
LQDDELEAVTGGYIGETEKNVSYVALRSEVKDSHDHYA